MITRKHLTQHGTDKSYEWLFPSTGVVWEKHIHVSPPYIEKLHGEVTELYNLLFYRHLRTSKLLQQWVWFTYRGLELHQCNILTWPALLGLTGLMFALDFTFHHVLVFDSVRYSVDDFVLGQDTETENHWDFPNSDIGSGIEWVLQATSLQRLLTHTKLLCVHAPYSI